MKKIGLFFGLVFFVACLHAQVVLPKPNPQRLVVDKVGALSPEQIMILENKLVALDDSTSNQIAVVIINTTADYDIQDYATKLFREWGIGNKKTNNGVLIIAAIDDRKVLIEVGYGLEGAIPDVMASAIYRNEIVPAFKKQDYYRGIDNAINALTKAAVGEYKMARSKKNDQEGSPFVFIIMVIIVIIVLAVISKGGKGGGGGGRQGFGDLANAIILSSLLNGGGSRSGGFGGFGGGSSSGGGGFGGFGGGSSGGGGAGGSW